MTGGLVCQLCPRVPSWRLLRAVGACLFSGRATILFGTGAAPSEGTACAVVPRPRHARERGIPGRGAVVPAERSRHGDATENLVLVARLGPAQGLHHAEAGNETPTPRVVVPAQALCAARSAAGIAAARGGVDASQARGPCTAFVVMAGWTSGRFPVGAAIDTKLTPQPFVDRFAASRPLLGSSWGDLSRARQKQQPQWGILVRKLNLPFDVVTGGGGFIGSHLVDALLAAGRCVRVIDNFSTGRRENLAQHEGDERLDVWVGDVADADLATRALYGAERVFHLAALADIVPSVEKPEVYFHANVQGTFAVMEAARRNGMPRLVYVASSTCYGIPQSFPTSETAPIDTRHPYALTKYLGEQLVLHWLQVYRLPAISLRLFNIYGPRARTTGTYGGVFGIFLAQMLAGKPLTVVGDGTQTRDFTFVSDAVRALLMAADCDRAGEVYNVGSGRPVSVNELVSLLGAERVVHIPKRPGEPDCTWADTRKIREHIGWTPKFPFEEGVRIMLDHIEYWRGAPVWTVEKIEEATADWFKYLGTPAV